MDDFWATHLGEWGRVLGPVLAGMSPLAMFGVYQQYKSYKADRADKIAERALTTDERREKALVDERAALSVAQREQLERVETDRDRYAAEADKLYALVSKLRTDLHRAWNVAFFWHDEYNGLARMARNLIHDLASQRRMTLDLLKKHCPDSPPPEWDPLPEMPRLPGGVDDPRAQE